MYGSLSVGVNSRAVISSYCKPAHSWNSARRTGSQYENSTTKPERRKSCRHISCASVENKPIVQPTSEGLADQRQRQDKTSFEFHRRVVHHVSLSPNGAAAFPPPASCLHSEIDPTTTYCTSRQQRPKRQRRKRANYETKRNDPGAASHRPHCPRMSSG